MVFATILTGLVPSFLMVALGGVIRARLSENAWQGLDRLNFEILFPALLFVAASRRPIAVSEVVQIGPAVWTILIFALLLGWLARPIGPERFLDFAGGWQTVWRFNSAIALVASQTLGPDAIGQMAVAIGMAVPVANLLAVAALSRGGNLSLTQTIGKVVMNPFLLASVLGVAVGLSGLTIPAPIMAPLDMVAAAAIPIALISIGATMNWRALARMDRFGIYISLSRLVLVPAGTFLVFLLIGSPDGLAPVLILFAALPTASAAHVLASGFGADRKLVATLIAQSTLLSAATLPLWILATKAVF
ncbi:AEC family transporter [Ruegeria marisrubri]|uniref:AEC family transporter n=1 Tax=Ruegeria marisrubri TaxID=1685379 RepID=UPI001CD4E9D2|nr:AEC family transporter [Ruegeria marisrubri]MCA0907983.1 AEC family transporter [Ruegeria marisrubri]